MHCALEENYEHDLNACAKYNSSCFLSLRPHVTRCLPSGSSSPPSAWHFPGPADQLFCLPAMDTTQRANCSSATFCTNENGSQDQQPRQS
eukprot:144424-Pelagomonas_calceolata.AAC.7